MGGDIETEFSGRLMCVILLLLKIEPVKRKCFIELAKMIYA